MAALVILVYLALTFVPAAIAQRQGREFALWWLYAVLLLPIAAAHALTLAPDDGELARRMLARGYRQCPHCAELVRREAVVCRYCTRDVPAAAPLATPGLLTPPPGAPPLVRRVPPGTP